MPSSRTLFASASAISVIFSLTTPILFAADQIVTVPDGSRTSYSCSTATPVDKCTIQCQAEDLGGITIDCANAGQCEIFCGQKKCLFEGTVHANNSDSLRIVSNGQQCVESATINVPQTGNATFTVTSTADANALSKMVVNAGPNTQNILINCSGECKNMVIHAQTAQFLHLYTAEGATTENSIIDCPQNSAYSGPAIAACIIDSSDGGNVFRLQINTINGIPQDVWIPDGASKLEHTTITCQDGDDKPSKQEPMTGWPTSGICWQTLSPSSEPTTNPTQDPSTYPSLDPTEMPSALPSLSPSPSPSSVPSLFPSLSPSLSDASTYSPSPFPSRSPSFLFLATVSPTYTPTNQPSSSPSLFPSVFPITPAPTNVVSIFPTEMPSELTTLQTLLSNTEVSEFEEFDRDSTDWRSTLSNTLTTTHTSSAVTTSAPDTVFLASRDSKFWIYAGIMLLVIVLLICILIACCCRQWWIHKKTQDIERKVSKVQLDHGSQYEFHREADIRKQLHPAPLNQRNINILEMCKPIDKSINCNEKSAAVERYCSEKSTVSIMSIMSRAEGEHKRIMSGNATEPGPKVLVNGYILEEVDEDEEEEPTQCAKLTMEGSEVDLQGDADDDAYDDDIVHEMRNETRGQEHVMNIDEMLRNDSVIDDDDDEPPTSGTNP